MKRLDPLSVAMRSDVMRAVKNRGAKCTEWVLRSAVTRAGVRGWKMHVVSLPGTPDFFFAGQHVAVFVDGCFWHGCPQCYRRPASKRSYWDAKKKRNQTRDKSVTAKLRRAGWSVLRLWEHSLTDKTATIAEIVQARQRRRKLRSVAKR